MRTVDINLASSPFRNDKPIWAVLAVFGVLALGFSGYNAWAYLTAGSRQAQLEQEIAGHRKRMHEMKAEAEALQAALAKVDEETLTSQAEFVASILDQRNFSWTHLFNSLEEVTPWDVKLLSIRPQFEVLNRRTGEGRYRIEVSGIGRTFDSFLDVQEALQGGELFSEVTPEEYERQGDDRVDFNLSFTYTPPKAIPGEENAAEGSGAVAGRSNELPGWPEGTAEQGAPGEMGSADAAADEADAAPAAPDRSTRGAGGGGPSGPGAAAAGAQPGAPPQGGRSASPAATGAPGGPAAIDPNAGLAGGVPVGPGGVPAATAAETRRSPTGRAPRGVPAGEEAAADAAAADPRAAGSGQPPVEVGEIDGKPVIKPRINPNRNPESGYRKRNRPPGEQPPGGNR